jgi:hypothetical protein
MDQSFCAGNNPRFHPAVKPLLKAFGFLVAEDRRLQRFELPNLLCKQIDVLSRCQGFHLIGLRVGLDHLEGTAPDGACRTEDGDSFHARPEISLK